jgi:hypothetical protein
VTQALSFFLQQTKKNQKSKMNPLPQAIHGCHPENNKKK